MSVTIITAFVVVFVIGVMAGSLFCSSGPKQIEEAYHRGWIEAYNLMSNSFPTNADVIEDLLKKARDKT